MRLVRTSLVLVAVITLVTPIDSVAQESAYVVVETNYPDAVLYADSLLVGGLGARAVAIPAETRSIRLVPPEVNTWSIAPVSAEMHAAPGDTVRVRLDFPYHYQIESVPFGADVLIEVDQQRQLIGETPLLHRSPEPLSGRVVISEAGYTVERVDPGNEVWNRHIVNLMPSDELDPTAAQVSWQPPRKHRAWIDYAALGTAVAAGALAVHYKFKADDLYSTYEETGDPSLRPRVELFDTRAGLAFGAMQVGIGVFALRLVLR